MVALRDPDITRQRILEVTAEIMRRQGYVATSLSDILKEAGISKGALYHHFANKQELAYAVFEEIFVPEPIAMWKEAAVNEDPLEGMCQLFSYIAEHLDSEQMVCGCPVNSISQEMSATDDGFRLRTEAMFQRIQRIVSEGLTTSLERGDLRDDVNIPRAALFIVCTFQGMSSMVKTSRSSDVAKEIMAALSDYVNSLRR